LKKKNGHWIAGLADVNKELLLILSIVASAGMISLLISGQRMALTIYNLPTLFAAYYFGRRRAMEASVASILLVVWVYMLHPSVLGKEINFVMSWSDLAVWAGFLILSAYIAGTLYDYGQRRMRELRETYYGVLQILNHFISNDKFTQNHSYRVSLYAIQIAGEMGMPEERIEDVRAAALLHDIGKLETSREILYKAARLTEDEMAHIRGHVDLGVDLLSSVGGSLSRILPIVLAHHDKFDGSGYHSNRGEQIPIEARIISVADVYDALVSDRPYRKGVSPFEARDTISKAAGKDFDPRVVKAFEAAFRKQRLEVPEVLV
jgi:putative nucleotidyltransferase with HDIG domain